MKSKLDAYIGFAKKSGNLVSGANTVAINMSKGKVQLLIIAEDMAIASREKTIKSAEKTGTRYRIYGMTDDLSHWAGAMGRSVFAILDKNFASIIEKAIDVETKEEKEVL